MSRIVRLIFVLISFLASPAIAAEPITVSQLMRVYGRALIAADGVALGMRSPTDKAIHEALRGIDEAIAVTDSVLALSCEEILLPAKVKSLEPEVRADYEARYRDYLIQFREALVRYRTGLERLFARPPEDRETEELRPLRDRVRDVATASHLNL